MGEVSTTDLEAEVVEVKGPLIEAVKVVGAVEVSKIGGEGEVSGEGTTPRLYT